MCDIMVTLCASFVLKTCQIIVFVCVKTKFVVAKTDVSNFTCRKCLNQNVPEVKYESLWVNAYTFSLSTGFSGILFTSFCCNWTVDSNAISVSFLVGV